MKLFKQEDFDWLHNRIVFVDTGTRTVKIMVPPEIKIRPMQALYIFGGTFKKEFPGSVTDTYFIIGQVADPNLFKIIFDIFSSQQGIILDDPATDGPKPDPRWYENMIFNKPVNHGKEKEPERTTPKRINYIRTRDSGNKAD